MTDQELSSSGNAVFCIHFHLVLVTKYRRKVLSEKAVVRCREIISATCNGWSVRCIECNGESDHIHALLDVPPRIRPSDLVNNLKTVTSRLLRKEFPAIRSAYKKPTLWSPSYCMISAGGAPLAVLRSYIENQGKRSLA
jgi:putative transposase